MGELFYTQVVDRKERNGMYPEEIGDLTVWSGIAGRDIFVRSLPDGTETRLTNHLQIPGMGGGIFGLKISRDHQYLAFFCNRAGTKMGGDPAKFDFPLWVLDRRNNQIRLLPIKGAVQYYEWSPAGHELAIESFRNGHSILTLKSDMGLKAIAKDFLGWTWGARPTLRRGSGTVKFTDLSGKPVGDPWLVGDDRIMEPPKISPNYVWQAALTANGFWFGRKFRLRKLDSWEFGRYAPTGIFWAPDSLHVAAVGSALRDPESVGMPGAGCALVVYSVGQKPQWKVATHWEMDQTENLYQFLGWYDRDSLCMLDLRKGCSLQVLSMDGSEAKRFLLPSSEAEAVWSPSN